MRDKLHEFLNIGMEIPDKECFFFQMEKGYFLILGTQQ
jgi:hypothetical protein